MVSGWYFQLRGRTGRIAGVVCSCLVVVWICMFALLFVGGGGDNYLRGKPGGSVGVSSFSASQTGDEQRRHLIIVPGHAVLRFDRYSEADTSDSSWYLLDYQKKQGFPHIISSHIMGGLQLLSEDKSALLLFSGGQSRHDVGPYSEALSYYFLAHYRNWIPSNLELESRIFLEEYARDSFENLLFSICRYREIVGSYPERVTVVGFDFKQHRYSEQHRRAILYPAKQFSYVALHSHNVTSLFDQSRAEHGEQVAIQEFETDPYGCNNKELREKRYNRDPFHRSVPYTLACPELTNLLHWCGPQLIDANDVPWAQ